MDNSFFDIQERDWKNPKFAANAFFIRNEQKPPSAAVSVFFLLQGQDSSTSFEPFNRTHTKKLFINF